MDSNRRPRPLSLVPHLETSVLALAALFLGVLALYRQTVATLVDLWTADNASYEHGLMLVGLCGFLFYQRWIRARPVMRVDPSLAASALIVLVSLGWLLASLVHLRLAQQISVVLLIALIVTAVIGFRSARPFLAPVALLAFAVPIGDPLVPHFQTMFAKLSVGLLSLTGIPTVLQGLHILVPAGTFEVKPACSGINQLIVAGAAGVLFATMRHLRFRAATVVTLGAMGVAVITNTLRICVTVLIGQFSGMQHYFVTEHWVPAWVLFGLGMLIYFLLVSRYVAAGTSTDSSARGATTPPAADSGVGARVAWSASLAFLALAIGPLLLATYRADRPAIRPVAFELPPSIQGWQAAPPPSHGYRPSFHGTDFEDEAVYRDAAGSDVYVYVAAYAYQEQGKEAVHVTNTVLPQNTWQVLRTGRRDAGQGALVQETRVRLQRGAEKLIWQWYLVQGRVVSSAAVAKLLNAWATLNGDESVGVVVISADLKGTLDSSQAEAELTRFFADGQQTIAHLVDRATGTGHP